MSVGDSAMVEFFTESLEFLERFNKNLDRIEKGEGSSEVLNEIYRDIHTIKGSSQLFGFLSIATIGHVMESCLDPVRNNMIALDEYLIDLLYEGADFLSELLDGSKETGQNIEMTEGMKKFVPKLIGVCAKRIDGRKSILSQMAQKSSSIPKVDLQTNSTLKASSRLANPPKKPKQQKIEGLHLFEDEEEAQVTRSVAAPSTPNKSISKENTPKREVTSKAKPVEKSAMDHDTTSPSLSENGTSTSEQSEASSKSKPITAKTKKEAGKETGSIRVQVGLLDDLMNKIGELVLIRNQVLQFDSLREDIAFSNLSQRLNIVTSELQNDVMKTRMQPVGNVFNKFHRVVRDLSKELEKSVNLVIEGADTELDKTLIEAVKDPLTHIIRNCVDHGIEKPKERLAKGKMEQGEVCVKAYHEGGQVVVEIQDDGKGLDPERIAQKAIDRGLLTNEQAERITNREIFQYIFHPGFSTAEKVSNISGRGVGMDVVKTNIEKIGGMVELSSEPGFETKIKLKIPLTLAIIPALIVRSGDFRFAVPQVKVIELVRLEREAVKGDGGIEMLQGQPVYRLRGNLLPLIPLAECIKNPKESATDVINIVVLNADGYYFGLVVDEIDDSADIVVKPLNSFLRDQLIYSGATILGDGTVILILDVLGIAQLANKRSETEDNLSKMNAEVSSKDKHYEITEYILIDLGIQSTYVIPLCLVSRLEVFDKSAIEYTGNQMVIRYRDSLLPLIDVVEELGEKQETTEKSLEEELQIRVVVVKRSEKFFGLIVDKILDVQQIDTTIDDSIKPNAMILGNIIWNEQVFVALDALSIIDSGKAKMNLLIKEGRSLEEGIGEKSMSSLRSVHKLLVVDDTQFFRNQLHDLLTKNGYKVEVANNGKLALNTLKKNPSSFSLVVSDIEMPVMNGFELATQVRESTDINDIPMVAISTRFSEKFKRKGDAAGFNSYLEKLNGNELIILIDKLLKVGGNNNGRQDDAA